MNLTIITPQHTSPTPLSVGIGKHTLTITKETSQKREPSGQTSARFNHEEAYKLYMCLHVLFAQQGTTQEEEEQ